MISLFPTSVTLGATELRCVESVAVNRTADKLIVDHSDLGPHVAFVDVPERRITIVVRRRVHEDEPTPAKPGDSVTLAFQTGETASPAKTRKVSASVIVTGLVHEHTRRGLVQTITMIAWSTDGAADPITESVGP